MKKALVLLFVAPVLVACGGQSQTPEESLRAALGELNAATQAGDREAFYSHLDMTAPACLSMADSLDAVSDATAATLLRQLGGFNPATVVIKVNGSSATVGSNVFRRAENGEWLSRC